jgi:hypothetical protein
LTIEQARDVLEAAYKSDIDTLAQRAARRIQRDRLSGTSAAEVVFDIVSASSRCRNLGQAVEALAFSDHDRAILVTHTLDCGCLDWSEPTVWSHFAAHAVAMDVMALLGTKYGIAVSITPDALRPHGSPDGLVS